MPLTKPYSSIAEVAKEIGESESTIRYWEKEFRIPTHKSPKGTRQFTLDNIEQLKKIRFLLRDQKLTIDGARKRLRNKHFEDTDTSKQLLKEKLIQMRKELNELLKLVGKPEDLDLYNQ